MLAFFFVWLLDFFTHENNLEFLFDKKYEVNCLFNLNLKKCSSIKVHSFSTVCLA